MDSMHAKATTITLVRRMVLIPIQHEVPTPFAERPRAWVEDRYGRAYICFWPGGDPQRRRVIDMVQPVEGSIPEGLEVVWRLQLPHLLWGYSTANTPAAYVYAAALAVSGSLTATTIFVAPQVPPIQGDGDIVRGDVDLPPVPASPTWVYRVVVAMQDGRRKPSVAYVHPVTLDVLDGPLEQRPTD